MYGFLSKTAESWLAEPEAAVAEDAQVGFITTKEPHTYTCDPRTDSHPPILLLRIGTRAYSAALVYSIQNYSSFERKQ